MVDHQTYKAAMICFPFILEDVSLTQFCSVKLTPASYDAFSYAIRHRYWYQMYIDDLPVWGKLQRGF